MEEEKEISHKYITENPVLRSLLRAWILSKPAGQYTADFTYMTVNRIIDAMLCAGYWNGPMMALWNVLSARVKNAIVNDISYRRGVELEAALGRQIEESWKKKNEVGDAFATYFDEEGDGDE